MNNSKDYDINYSVDGMCVYFTRDHDVKYYIDGPYAAR